MVGQVIWMNVRIFCSILAWTFLLAMGCSIAIVLTALISEYLALAMWLLMLVSISAVALRYELAPFLLHDYPEAGAGTAVRRSSAMMQGHIWQLIKLYLSFWPWYLLQFLLTAVAWLIALLPVLSGLLSTALSGDPLAVYEQFQLALSGTLTTILALIVQLIIEPRFFPYRRIAVANFYRALSGDPMENSFSDEPF